jgi:hypothetical protein
VPPTVSFLDPSIAKWIKHRETPPRTDGPHVSRILTSMLKTAMPAKYAHYGMIVDGQREPAFELGYTWEDALANALRVRLALEPGYRLMDAQEINRDGIYGNPDRPIFDVMQERWIVEELKLTWYSCGGLETDPYAILENQKFAYWLMQVKTYAAMLLDHRPSAVNDQLIIPCGGWPRLREAPIARIRSLFVNGDYKYKGDQRARPFCWEIEWPAIELEEWWAAVVRHAEKMKLEQTT